MRSIGILILAIIITIGRANAQSGNSASWPLRVLGKPAATVARRLGKPIETKGAGEQFVQVYKRSPYKSVQLVYGPNLGGVKVVDVVLELSSSPGTWQKALSIFGISPVGAITRESGGYTEVKGLKALPAKWIFSLGPNRDSNTTNIHFIHRTELSLNDKWYGPVN